MGVKWTVTARLQVIEAVIKVERELTIERNRGARLDRRKKWERILKHLPPALRVKGFRDFKCQHVFYVLVQAYRVRQNSIGRRAYVKPITEAECELLKKWDELRATRFSPRAENHEAQLSPTRYGPLNSSINQGHRSEGLVGAETDGRAAESSEEGALCDNHAEEMERTHFDGKHGTSVGTSLRDASRFSSGPQDSHKKTRLPRRCARSSSGKLKDPECSPEPRTRAQHRAQFEGQPYFQPNSYSAETGHSNSPCVSRSERNATSYRTQKASNERYRTLLDGSIRRLDLGFSELGTWVHSQLIPEARKVMDEMTSSASTSAKRRNVHHPAQSAAAEPFNDLMQMNLKSMVDSQIRASLQKLKIRFTREVKNTSVELARDLRQALQIGEVFR